MGDFKYIKVVVLVLLIGISEFSFTQNNYLEFQSAADKAIREYAYTDAISAYHSALRACKNCDQRTVVDLHLSLAQVHALNADYPKQFASISQAMKAAKMSKSNNLIARVKINEAEYFRGRATFDMAIQALDSVQSMINGNDVSKEVQVYYHNRYAAVINESSEDINRSLDHSNKALELATAMNDTNLIATSLNEIGFSHEGLGSYAKATRHYEKAKDLWLSVGDKRSATQVLSNIARCEFRNGNYENSIDAADEGLLIVDTNKWLSNLVYLYGPKILSLEKIGRYKEAYEAQRISHQYALDFKENDWSIAIARIDKELKLAEKNELIANEKRAKQAANIAFKEQRSKTNYLLIILGVSLLLISIVFFFAFNYYRSKKQLQLALNSKELLLKEVHHRVKNNLQVISSLLNQQVVRSSSPQLRELVDEGQRRIKSMAMIHQKLYQTNDFTDIRIAQYAKELTASIAASLSLKQIDVDVTYDLDEAPFEIDTAISVGLILNELITNAFKYAFAGCDSGTLFISLKKTSEKDMYELIVKDDGIGLPDDFEERSSKSLGINLVRGLSWQLRGNMTYSSDNGSIFTINFNSKAAQYGKSS